MDKAPIVLFVYNRLSLTKRTLEFLSRNYLAGDSNLYVFSDGWKNNLDKKKVEQVRIFLKSVAGFKNITIYESSENRGLANSIIEGVTQIISKYGKVIVLEDDLITSPNFLIFMNNALSFYKENDSVFSISGYSMNLPSLVKSNKDYYITNRASSWGWATWSRSWDDIDWEIKDYSEFIKSTLKKKKFNNGGSDMTRMLKNQMVGKIDSWAIRWCYNQFKRNQYTIYPTVSKIKSIGFGIDATHTKRTNRFRTEIDTELKTRFIFDFELIENRELLKEFRAKFSVFNRLKDKFL